MSIKRMYLQNFRNLQSVTLRLSPHLNLITGDNGSGKTSILEAIHVLSCGKSFRTNTLRHVVQDSQNEFILSVKKTASFDREVVLGVCRSKSAWQQIKINGQQVDRLSMLAKELPVVFIGPNSDQIIEGSPSVRRRFIDWGVFHVEHRFYTLWLNMRRILKQRNALLMAQGRDVKQLTYWNEKFIDVSEQITQLRRNYVENLDVYFKRYIARFFGDADFSLRYLQGWPEGKDLLTLLTCNVVADLKHCRTEYGPHRADIQMLHQGKNIRERVSRGQMKLILFSLCFAQIAHMREEHKKVTSLLLDDIFTELDNQHKNKVFDFLIEEQVQTLLTTTHLDTTRFNAYSPAVFHVKHGNVSVLN